jgi:integrase
MLREYLASIAGKQAPSTHLQHNAWQRHIEAVFGEMDAASITQGDIAKYLDLCPRTSGRSEISLLSKSYSRWLKLEKLTFNPCIGAKSDRKRASRDRYLTHTELSDVLSHAPPLLSVAIELSYATGLRISDLCKLRWDQFDDGSAVHTKKTGARQRYVLDNDFRELLAQARALQSDNVGSIYVLSGRGGQPLIRQTVGRWWRKALKAAGIEERAIWHDIRAKAGTDVDAAGQDATKFLGHTDPNTTKAYLRGRKITTVAPLKRVKM